MFKNKAQIGDGLKEKVSPKNFTKNPIKGTKFTVMVSSAKGGVGKSTFSINLLFALQNLGHKVGLLDADIYGPSLPKMIGLNEKPKTSDGKFLLPLEKYGAQFMSLGFLVDECARAKIPLPEFQAICSIKLVKKYPYSAIFFSFY